MKILVITRNAWDDTNAIGNTLSNFFGGVEDVEFSAIYFRSARPNNAYCKKYYHTSETEILKKWFKPADIGRSFSVSDSHVCTEHKKNKEKTVIRAIHKYGLKLAYKVSDALWYSEKWINKRLDDFIEEFDPDLVVTFVKSAPQYYLTIKHLREKYNVPLFSWIADDEYSALLKNKAKREIENLRYILNESAVVKGCSEELCEYYNSVFGCNATPLYKSCDLSAPIKERSNETTTIVYAGNLLYGRAEIISRFAGVVESLEKEDRKISLEIYSNTELLGSEVQKYFPTQTAKYMGRKPYEFIKNRLSEADIVLHVESFEDEEILKTKYSFSTKIIDYLQSGSVLLAIGPEVLSSIKYISRIPGACVINDMDNVYSSLKNLLDNPISLHKRATEIREFAQLYHNSSVASKEVTKMFNEIIKKGE